MEYYFQPAALALANGINQFCSRFAALNALNAVGTPGTTPTARTTYTGAMTRLVNAGLAENRVPKCIINRNMSDAFIEANAAIFNPAGTISRQYTDGQVAESALGMSWAIDQTLYTHTIGAYAGSPLVNGATQVVANAGDNGTMSLITDGWTANTSTLNEGDRFTIAGVLAVHPQTKQSTGQSKIFTVKAAVTADGSGNKTIVASPAITPDGPYQNVTAAAADNAVITVIGAASTVTTQGLAMDKNAFGFVSVALENPAPGTGAKGSYMTDPKTGVTVSMVQYYDGDSRENKMRLDTLFGAANLYPELATSIYSGA